ncbi:uncharacterized protein [Procambarus clarkii]
MAVSTSKSKQWQCRLTNTRDRIAFLKDKAFLSDLTITFPGHKRVIQAHRFLLAAHSPVFEAMLCGPMAEEGILTLVDDQPEAFDFLLDFIYLEKVNLPDVEMAIQVYTIAHKYQIDALCEICSMYQVEEVDAESFPCVYDTALLLEDEKLLQRCDEVLATSSEEVLESKNFGLLRPSSLKKILGHPKLHVSDEGKVFSAIISWGLAQLTAEKCETLRSELENKISYCTADKTKDDGDSSAKKLSDNGKNEIEGEAASQVKCNTEKPFVSSLRQVVVDFLPFVRFLLMTSDQFVRYILPSGVLSNGECVAILQNIEGAHSIDLPDFVSFRAAKPRERITKSCLVYDRSFNDGVNLNFVYYSTCCTEVLKDFKTSRPIFLIRISSPCISSLQEGDVTVQTSSNEKIAKGTWRGVNCQFRRPVPLDSDQTYTVTLSIKESLITTASAVSSVNTEHEGVNFVGKTRCGAKVEIEYFVNN